MQLGIIDGGSFPPCPSCDTRGESHSLFLRGNRCHSSSHLRIAEAARVRDGRRPHSTGILKPAIVLYDEPHPWADGIQKIKLIDLRSRPDMMIIMGTSLHIPGIRDIVLEFADALHSRIFCRVQPLPLVVYINLTHPPKQLEGKIDYWVQGSADEWSRHCMQYIHSGAPPVGTLETSEHGEVQSSIHSGAGFPGNSEVPLFS